MQRADSQVMDAWWSGRVFFFFVEQ